MKNTPLPIVVVFALGSFAPAAESKEDLWNKMFQVLFVGPRLDKEAQLKQLESLIDEGADVNAAILFDRMAREGETLADLRGTAWPLDIAVQQTRLDMIKLLLARGAKFHGGELAQAALTGNHDDSLAMVKLLLQAGADANSRHDDFTALFWASYKGNKESVTLLLAQPALKLDETNRDGYTALMAAAERGHAEIVEMLLKAGASASVTGWRGVTAASLAQKTLAKQEAIVEKQKGIISKLQPDHK